MARRVRRKNTLPEITLTPLIDTALTLLVIFMIATPMMHNAIKVRLPESNAQDIDPAMPQEFIVSIDESGQLFLNGVAVTDLVKELEQITQNRHDLTVFIKGDYTVPYGKLIDIYDEIKKVNGIKHVAFSTTKKRSATSMA